ncbi:hypothetical protein V6N12_049512 [Hibiscus sabdariffa]|uniref:Uncharacterized protein n=1 Tax=Hibiscus sabdariffa TaxID=183260 RepID=A0ABR2CBI7_9ROSI
MKLSLEKLEKTMKAGDIQDYLRRKEKRETGEEKDWKICFLDYHSKSQGLKWYYSLHNHDSEGEFCE